MNTTLVASIPQRSGARSLKTLFTAIHRDQRGAVSLETVLILGAVAIPVLIILLKFGWPKIKLYFDDGMKRLDHETGTAIENG